MEKFNIRSNALKLLSQAYLNCKNCNNSFNSKVDWKQLFTDKNDFEKAELYLSESGFIDNPTFDGNFISCNITPMGINWVEDSDLTFLENEECITKDMQAKVIINKVDAEMALLKLEYHKSCNNKVRKSLFDELQKENLLDGIDLTSLGYSDELMNTDWEQQTKIISDTIHSLEKLKKYLSKF